MFHVSLSDITYILAQISPTSIFEMVFFFPDVSFPNLMRPPDTLPQHPPIVTHTHTQFYPDNNHPVLWFFIGQFLKLILDYLRKGVALFCIALAQSSNL